MPAFPEPRLAKHKQILAVSEVLALDLPHKVAAHTSQVSLGEVPEDCASHPFRQAAVQEMSGHMSSCELSRVYETFGNIFRRVPAAAALLRQLLEQTES